MTRSASSIDEHSVALHSGDYVARYNAKPLTRVQRLVSRMHLTKETRVADFACGNGMLLHAMGDSFASYDGVDFSPDFIASANAWAERENCRDYRFHLCDIRDFCRANPQAFDVATTLDFSEHVDDALAIEIYSSIRGALRPGGRLYLHTPNLDFFMERARQFGLLPRFPEHIAVRTGKATAALLEHAGFAADAIDVQIIPHYNILKVLHPLSRLPVVGPLFSARLFIEAVA
ncbi:class I SAM-dependent methyltransferase [Altererythrobacter fulvus]|uniref:class I SAM-dependent methyltransferase n=1 Tax=Caenibius fulvus TaxID=2126012 RepID=UPI00301AE592